jgi:hypothetical protein
MFFQSRLEKNIHLDFYTETAGCDCSSKALLMMGKMLPKHVEQRLHDLKDKRFCN